MATWVAGTEESTVAQTGGGLPGRGALPGRGSTDTAQRVPVGTWHAVDLDSGRPACGTNRFLEVWPDHPSAQSGDAPRCPECAAVTG